MNHTIYIRTVSHLLFSLGIFNFFLADLGMNKVYCAWCLDQMDHKTVFLPVLHMYQSTDTKSLLSWYIYYEVKYGKLDRLKSGIGSNSKGCSPLSQQKNPNRFLGQITNNCHSLWSIRGLATVAWKMVLGVSSVTFPFDYIAN